MNFFAFFHLPSDDNYSSIYVYIISNQSNLMLYMNAFQ